jgi:tRNA A-37 threonylcarbamoyl transferase component Bud32
MDTILIVEKFMSVKKIYKDRYTGSVEVYGDFVIKFYNEKSKLYGNIEREIFWLNKLFDFDRTPNIIEHGDDFIKMEYVGERLNKTNLPYDWEEQVKYILNSLNKYECSHNDIKPEDILVNNGLLYIIDFGWSTPIGSEIPSNWPDLGDDFKISKHNFNDEHSFNKTINMILNENFD